MTTPFQITQTSLFRPTQVSGCTIWLDGADPNGNGSIPINGSTVSSWIDKSSNGMTVSAASSQPLYSTNLQNGLGALTFDGTKNLATGNVLASKFAGNTTNLTIFCVNSFSNTVTGGTYASPFCWANSGNYPRICLTVGNNADGVMMDVGASGTGRTSYAVPPPTFDSKFYITSYWKSGANSQLNLNGSNKASSSTQDTTGFASSTYAFNVGAAYASSIWNMRGDIGEILFFNSTLSTQNFQTIEGYLAWKWGLQNSLPSTHPYRNTPVYSLQPFPLVPRVPYGTNVNLPLPFPLLPLTRVATNKYFNPTSITGCVIWFDGADTSQLSFTGTTVNSWTSKGSASLTATSVGAGSIVYEKYNGVNSLRFNGTNTKMTTGTVASYGASATTWITASVNLTAVTATTPTDASLVFATSGAPEKSIRYTQSPGSQLYTFNNGSFRDSQNFTNGVRGFIDTAASFAAYVNGANATNSTSAVTYEAGVNQSFSMGQWASGTLNGYIQEIIVYTSALSLSQYQQVEGYLAWKWGFQSNLPSSHPYKVFPPSP